MREAICTCMPLRHAFGPDDLGVNVLGLPDYFGPRGLIAYDVPK